MISETLNTRAENDTIITTVEFDFDGEKVVADVLHFQPQTEEEVAANINTYGEYLQKKREASARCAEIADQLSGE